MVLNPKLIMPQKYAKLAPYLRKKKGRPMEKRIALLKAQQADARPFVDKARQPVCECDTDFIIWSCTDTPLSYADTRSISCNGMERGRAQLLQYSMYTFMHLTHIPPVSQDPVPVEDIAPSSALIS
jgi:hypothetical protein